MCDLHEGDSLVLYYSGQSDGEGGVRWWAGAWGFNPFRGKREGCRAGTCAPASPSLPVPSSDVALLRAAPRPAPCPAGHGGCQPLDLGSDAEGNRCVQLLQTLLPLDFKAEGFILDTELNRLLVNQLPAVRPPVLVVLQLQGSERRQQLGCCLPTSATGQPTTGIRHRSELPAWPADPPCPPPPAAPATVQGVKLTAIIDACHCGTLLELPYRATVSRGHAKWEAVHEERPDRVCRGCLGLLLCLRLCLWAFHAGAGAEALLGRAGHSG